MTVLKSWRLLVALAAVAAAGSVGCSSVSNPDKPTRLGPVDEPPPGVLRLELMAAADHVRRGEAAWFDVRIRNDSDGPLALPVSPIVILLWRYRDGKTDNQLRMLPAKVAYGPQNLRRLDAGQQLQVRVSTGTAFFPIGGITEFQAMLYVPAPEGPTDLPVPAGRFYSGRYGIMVLD